MRERDKATGALGRRLDVEVGIPLELLLKLHSVKALTGRDLGDIVAEALRGYFDRLESARDLDATP